MRDRGGYHLLDHLLGLRKLVLELGRPVAEQDHRARVVVVLDVDDGQSDDLGVVHGNVVELFARVLGRVDDVVEAVWLAEDEGRLDAYGPTIVNRVTEVGSVRLDVVRAAHLIFVAHLLNGK